VSDVLSSMTVGVADRYAAQIRELLAMHEAQLTAQRLMAASQPPESRAKSQIISPLAATVDLRV
jgi:hypothetical protein